MKNIIRAILIVFLSINFLYAKSEELKEKFIQICKNPTKEQLNTILYLIDGYNVGQRINNKEKLNINDQNICEVLSNGHSFPDTSRTNLKDISILKYFSENKSLNLRGNKIEDITALKYLKELEDLNMFSLEVEVKKGVESLRYLPLKHLSINIADGVDISAIGNIKTLEDLSIGEGYDAKILNNLTNLKELGLYSNSIKSICEIKDLRNLERLILVTNENFTSLECIENFTKLKQLKISHGSVTDLSPLANLKELKELEIVNIPIKDLSALSNLKNLTELTLDKIPVTDLTPLIPMDKLRRINLKIVPVSDLSPLAKMKALDTLVFFGTNVKYLSVLKDSKTLKTVIWNRKYYQHIKYRTLANCSPKNMKEIREGKTCFNEDGTLKPLWKRVLRW